MPDRSAGSVELLAKEAASLIARLRLWTPSRWAAAAEPWGARADLAHHLAQWFADAEAQVQGVPPRRLPRISPDLLVVDQLAVTTDDLLLARPSAQLCAAAVAHLLVHRFDLLAEEPPAALGGAAVLGEGRAVCEGSFSSAAL